MISEQKMQKTTRKTSFSTVALIFSEESFLFWVKSSLSTSEQSPLRGRRDVVHGGKCGPVRVELVGQVVEPKRVKDPHSVTTSSLQG